MQEPEKVSNPVMQITNRTTANEAQAHDLLLAARQALQDGAHQQATTLLQDALDLDVALHEARENLLALYMRNNDLESAAKAVEAGLRLAPDNELYITTRARLLAEAEDYASAIQYLSEYIRSGKARTESRSALAAFYQQVGEYSASTALYQYLLTIDPARTVWWLGLAISLENTGHTESSLAAFRQVLQGRKSRPDLAQYARQRISVLSTGR